MSFTSLQGYATATYDEIVEVFGEPDYTEPSGDDKVTTQWDLTGKDYADRDIPVTIYDWKQWNLRCRDGNMFRWHIGGHSGVAAHWVNMKLIEHRSKGSL